MNYLEPIKWAMIIFPFLAFFFTMPYILYQYRKYGSIISFRAIIIYSFLLYLLTSYFLVILPLPSITTVSNMTGPTIQLKPFAFLIDFIEKSSFNIQNPSTYLTILTEPYFYQVFYNILLFIPFGIYLHYYFKCSTTKTILYSILLSLFFEVTQLSGLYGVYPRPYRLFDVDDLMLNTLGGTLGYFITPIITPFLPTRNKLDEESYQKGKKVSYFRRCIANIFDLIFLNFLILFIKTILPNIEKKWLIIGSICIYFVIYPYFKNHQTLGKKIVKIKSETCNHTTPTLFQYFIKYAMIWIFLYELPQLFLHGITLFSALTLIHPYLYLGYCGIMLLVIIILYIVHPFLSIIKHKPFLYEKYSQIINVSTITINQSEEKIEE